MAVALNWDEMAVVGRVARPHGLRGHVIVNPETDFPVERFRLGAEVFVRRAEDVEPLTIAAVHFQQGRPVIALSGVDDVDAAQALAGTELRIPRRDLTPLPDGTFYHHDLIGCMVETISGSPVGPVTAVEGTSLGSRLVVEGERGEVLVPLADDICRRIDLEGKRISIDPPEGLLELNRK